MPGGTIGWPARTLGYPGTGKYSWSPYKGIDGFIETDHFGPTAGLRPSHSSWPMHMPHLNPDEKMRNPGDIFSESSAGGIYYQSDREEFWKRLGISDRVEMLIAWGSNVIMAVANRDIIVETLMKLLFIVML